MAKQRAIVYFMHETELHSAEQAMTSALVTDSFAIGEMEDTKIAELRKQGIIVNLLPSPDRPTGMGFDRCAGKFDTGIRDHLVRPQMPSMLPFQI